MNNAILVSIRVLGRRYAAEKDGCRTVFVVSPRKAICRSFFTVSSCTSLLTRQDLSCEVWKKRFGIRGKRFHELFSRGYFKAKDNYRLVDHLAVDPMTSSRFIRNTTLHEVYIVEDEVLGVGASGKVKSITNRASGQRFALKSLPTVFLSKKRWNMLLDEVEIFLSMDHPHICKLCEVYQDEEAVHLVMELCKGRALASHFESYSAFSEREAAKACLQMLEVLSYLHWQKVCHRDIKLDNWVYADDAEGASLKLIDFGLSKRFSSLDSTAMEGTAAYMAPEIWEGDSSEKVDIWATGVIAHVMLSGSLPFAGKDNSEIVRLIMMHGFPLEGAQWASVSEHAKDFVSKLLKDDPEERLTALEAIHHPWLKGLTSSPATVLGTEDVSVDVLHTLQEFASRNAFCRAACGVLAFNTSPQHMQQVEAEFRKLDIKRNGMITLDELTSVLKRRLGLTDAQASSIFHKLDQTGNHEIHYSEFLAAAVFSRSIWHKNAIREAFDKFDVDGKGFISLEDFQRVLGEEYGGKRTADIFAAADTSNDGIIGYHEFVEALKERPVNIERSATTRMDLIRKASRRTLGRIARQQSRRALGLHVPT